MVAEPELPSTAEGRRHQQEPPAPSGRGPGFPSSDGGTGIIYVTSTPPEPEHGPSITSNMMRGFGSAPSTSRCCRTVEAGRAARGTTRRTRAAHTVCRTRSGPQMAPTGADGRPTLPRVESVLATSRPSTGIRPVPRLRESQRMLLIAETADVLSQHYYQVSDNGGGFTDSGGPRQPDKPRPRRSRP